MENEFNLRTAETEEEKQASYRLRYELYVEEQSLFQKVADHERRWLSDEYDECSDIILAESNGCIIGTTRSTWGSVTTFSQSTRDDFEMDIFSGIVDERDMVVVSRLLVRKEYRGTVLAFQLLWKSWEYAARCGAELILGSCEPHLLSHYWKYGFRPYGKISNHPTNGILVPIAVVAGDFDHLRKINSPMLTPLSLRPQPSQLVDQILPLLTEDVAVKASYSGVVDDYFDEVAHHLVKAEKELAGIFGDREGALVILAKSHILKCSKGDALIYKGQASRTLFILLSGSLTVQENGQTVATVNKNGALVGEVALFSKQPRMSDVIAGPDGARVLALNNSTLRELIHSYGTVTAKFMHYVVVGLCEKLQERAGISSPPENS